MPVMDGETLGKAIMSQQPLAATRMVMLTSVGDACDSRRFLELGFSGFATKPLRPAAFKTVLANALADRVAQPLPSLPEGHSQPPLALPNRPAGPDTRILVVEDNLTNQLVALGILKKLGWRADVAANGEEALQALARIRYHLVLMDMQMPVMDGLEATRRIRSWHPDATPGRPAPLELSGHQAHASRIPIIAMTANTMPGDRERCLACGMNDFVSKPVSPQAVAAAINRWLPQPALPVEPAPAGPAGQTQSRGGAACRVI